MDILNRKFRFDATDDLAESDSIEQMVAKWLLRCKIYVDTFLKAFEDAEQLSRIKWTHGDGIMTMSSMTVDDVCLSRIVTMSHVSRPVTAQPVVRLIEELSKLPGIGQKTASRLAYHLLRTSRDDAIGLAEAILEVRERMRLCRVCFNTTDIDPCGICADPGRENIICVVEDPLDVVALERTHEFRGKYHVLHGSISPVDGIGPDKLRVRELVDRVQSEEPGEVIVFTNLDLAGEATATYLHRLLTPMGVTVTRPASGLPAGSDMEYSDDITLGRALSGRRAL